MLARELEKVKAHGLGQEWVERLALGRVPVLHRAQAGVLDSEWVVVLAVLWAFEWVVVMDLEWTDVLDFERVAALHLAQAVGLDSK